MPIENNLRLRAETAAQSHWRQFSDPLNHERITKYFEELLPLEVQCAESDKDEPARLPAQDKQGGVLVLLVGFSIDPLLQSICAYKPDQVVLVLNARYGEPPDGRSGQEFGNYVASFFPSLTPKLIANQISASNGNVEFIILDKDHPSDVFRKLREKLLPRLQKGERLVLDITGGKKSMVAGAFLFGAFTGVSISYVDFDEYDPVNRAPRGYTCCIGILPNPYETFRIRDWERVRELYNRYMFRNVGAILDQIIPSMNGWFSDDEIRAANTLRQVMTMYELWDNGDYCGALNTYEGFKNRLKGCLRLPTAVEVLGKNNYWPSGEDPQTLLSQLKLLEQGNAGRPSLYVDVEKLLIYTRDELAKVQRLVKYNEDCRSALLRAVGLTEVLLRARLLILIHSGKVEVAIKPNPNQSAQYQSWSEIDSEMKQSIEKQIVEEDSVYRLIPALRYRADGSSDDRRKQTRLRCQKGQGECEVWLRRASDAPRLDENGEFLKSLNDIKELRNKAIHTYLSVRHSSADASLVVAKKSLSEFTEKWAVLISGQNVQVHTDSVKWTELCEVCGITFLPPSKEET
jgi:hypothetical protein